MLTMVSGNTFYFAWEVTVQEWLQHVIASDVGIKIASLMTMLGEEIILIAVLGFLYWSYDKEFGRYVGNNILVALVVTPMLKNVFFRRRPYFDHQDIQILKPVDSSADIYDISAQGYSFPSGHSTNSAALYGSIAAYRKKNKALCVIGILVPFFVGVSRVMLGAHYVTDVLAGWLVGLCTIVVFSNLQKHVKNENLLHLIVALLCLTGFFYCKTTDYYTGYGMMLGYYLAVPFEKRFVNFKTTDNLVKRILRVIGGGAIYFGLNTLLKLPFSEELLSSPTTPAFLLRTVRYALIVFVLIGVYPLLFDRFSKPRK